VAAASRPKRRRTLPRLSDLTRSKDGFPTLLNPGRWLPLPPIWMEGRVATEFMALQKDPVFAGKGVPRGDGRPVLLVPGFWSGDFSMHVLSDWLRRVGYQPELGGINFNIRYSEVLVKALARRLLEVYRSEGRKVTVLGHSRGGLLAKVLSHRYYPQIDQVIALGSPLADPFDINPLTMVGVRAAQLFNVVAYGRPATVELRFMRDLKAKPRVPVTNVYSRSDGIVNWRACLREDIHAIEVRGSHVGLAVNPETYRVLGQVLAAGWQGMPRPR
jgi:pimeloyl-ACP methyl ester carboxylesterase